MKFVDVDICIMFLLIFILNFIINVDDSFDMLFR